ncbi:MAG: alpha/beta fold hydrolase [Bacteroidota bacterium]
MHINIAEGVFIRHNQLDEQRDSIWLIHGFADSGLVYQESFQSKLAEHFNLFVPDMPGFGVSPLGTDHKDIKRQAALLADIIKKSTKENRNINLVAHSIGGLIGTWICQQLEDRINHYVNVEGNLTEADSYFSNKPLKYANGQEFLEAFEQEIFKKAQAEERYRRYYASLRFAQIEGMVAWAESSQEHIKNNRCGHEFIQLKCPKTYLWGDLDTPLDTQTFIREHKLPHKRYPGIGHWHMVENPTRFYDDILHLCKA